MFYDFDTFLNNLIYLWPLYAFFLTLLIVAIKCFFEWVRKTFEKVRARRTEELQEIVAANSEWYWKVLKLNRETKYYSDILNSGHSVYYFDANSKAQFNKMLPSDALSDFLSNRRETVEHVLEQVYRNRVINEAYDKKFRLMQSSATPELCEELGMDYEEFLEIERIVVRKCKLKIIHSYSVSCYVRYISPQGRNRYTKHGHFDEVQVRMALKQMDRLEAYRETEEYRRKNVRSKVTPSLRYDVMKRDGFRCCLCGRSAENGIELEVDHIIPVSKGGDTTYNNLQTLCRDCNRGKGAKV